jgi:hypothetical protein
VAFAEELETRRRTAGQRRRRQSQRLPGRRRRPAIAEALEREKRSRGSLNDVPEEAELGGCAAWQRDERMHAVACVEAGWAGSLRGRRRDAASAGQPTYAVFIFLNTVGICISLGLLRGAADGPLQFAA